MEWEISNNMHADTSTAHGIKWKCEIVNGKRKPKKRQRQKANSERAWANVWNSRAQLNENKKEKTKWKIANGRV